MKETEFSINEMKERFQKYGVVFDPAEIKEEVDDLIGLEDKKQLMEDFFLALKKYQDISPLFNDAGISPRFTMLLYGPPGTGKSALTKAMAKKHNIPIGLVEADRLVSPLLGDTIKNIRGAFEIAAEFSRANGVFILFFDEIDAIASERANMHEVGEIKRAVITFLQVMDQILYEGIPLAIFGATNHQSQLDSAVWRRFTYHLKFDFPNFIIRREIILSFLNKIQRAKIGIDKRIFDKLDSEYNFLNRNYNKRKESLGRDLTDDEMDDLFEEVRAKGLASFLYITRGYTGSDILRGTRVALLKAIQKSMLEFEDFRSSLVMVGGTKSHVVSNQKRFYGDNNGQANRQEKDLKGEKKAEESGQFGDGLDELGDLDLDF